ncbi:recombination protein RecR [Flavobacterium jejuense]|uniref:Recombination protein RecR n=1 Tax=Flavobacterium jejuense TaxID=1544455 RepID=A0ABX0IR04_9FLAO|nr:recombination mediator RecR [Flavobacterium jejuense]NHN26138.1 recombination protein RecR [Flavobacterium jejuense]
MELPSKLLENAVNEIAQLPGIGKRTALRLALHLLRQPLEQTNLLTSSLDKMRNEINYCEECYNISDTSICLICSNTKRDKTTVCVVEDVRDVMAIEGTGFFKGVYHVLGGKINPIEGVGPSQLNIKPLIEKVKKGNITEIIFALSSTMEGDTTNFYIFKQLKEFNITTSTIARGIGIGDELEYTDEVTLGRSLMHRIPFEQSIKQV